MHRIACLAAALLAAVFLGGCQGAEESAKSAEKSATKDPLKIMNRMPESPDMAAKPAPRPAPPQAKASVPRNGGGPASANGKGAAHPPAMAEMKAERPRPAMANGDRPMAAVISPALGADQERMRRRGDYITGLQKGAYTFNPPSPIKVAQPITVALWVDPVKEAAQLAEEMKKAFPESAARVESGATTWSPRMKATLTGVDFEITPVEGKDFDGVKDLSMTARTEWGWTLVPTSPGTKKLHLLLAVVLPSELGKPGELPQISRDVEVEVTVWWLIDHYWEKYWKWMIGGLASAAAAAIAWWWKKRFGGGS